MNRYKTSSWVLALVLAGCADSDPSSETSDDPGTTAMSFGGTITGLDPADTGGTTGSMAGTTGSAEDSTGAPVDGSSEGGGTTGGSSAGSSGGSDGGSTGTTGEDTSGSSSGSGDESTGGEPIVDNLVENPGFEVNTAGWATWGASLAVSTLQAHSGTSSGLVTNRTEGWHGAVYGIAHLVAAEMRYDVSIHARLSGTASGIAHLTVQHTCDGEAAAYTRLVTVSLSDEGWTEMSGVLTAPSCLLASMNVYVDGLPTGVDFFIDDLSVVELPPPTNLIANPDFETDATGWFARGAGSIEVSADRFHGGAQSGLVTGRTDTWHGPATDLLGALTPGEYSGSAWVSLGTGAADVHLSLVHACEGEGQSFNRVGTAAASDAGWSQASGTFTVPDCTLSELALYLEGPDAGVDIYVDDVSVTE